ncbi:hypothetical protein BDN72DRAFT_489567 [Pluteus cervinus]|uniref:Uncharacterized protein n=1 Tax=Pluteus cervinus TaxID=181527 RepID=A0ACD3A5K9_9AGAR|nr:hypothetical protein BDN72DRAFT_489567 [Pluteus cervinus]
MTRLGKTPSDDPVDVWWVAISTVFHINNGSVSLEVLHLAGDTLPGRQWSSEDGEFYRRTRIMGFRGVLGDMRWFETTNSRARCPPQITDCNRELRWLFRLSRLISVAIFLPGASRDSSLFTLSLPPF